MRPVTTRRQLIGLWRRTELRWPDGRLDTTTRVWWLQADRHYVDLRLPSQGPAEGFAGELLPEADAWHWRRDLDLSLPSTFRDVGRLAFTDETHDHMLEEGVEQPYTEIWQRVHRPPGPVCVWRDERDGAIAGQLVAMGGLAMLARPGEISLGEAAGADDWVVTASNLTGRLGRRLIDDDTIQAWPIV